MTIFLNLRARPAGGEVADQVSPRQVTVAPATSDVTDIDLPLANLASVVLGKNIILATHGFNVNQLDGYKTLANWSTLLQLDGTWLFIGIVWPGDSSWLGPLCYPGEGKHAIVSGNRLAQFLIDNFAGAHSVSFASHSLGARFILQTVTAINNLQPKFAVQHVSLMAGAINHDCLTAEYAAAAQAIGKISLLASVEDEVLAAAFPIGNVLEYPVWQTYWQVASSGNLEIWTRELLGVGICLCFSSFDASRHT
jgi:esterase/lipase superfamily enzyme